MKITAAQVNELRKKTGAGMMDCKKALTEAEGNIDNAIDILRKKGQKIASKRADREAMEGVVLAKTSEDNTNGIIISLNCETDFVAKNDDFVAFANAIADTAIKTLAPNLQELLKQEVNGLSIENNITDQIAKIGEKIELSAYEIVNAEYVSTYNHHNKKLAAIVGVTKNTPDTQVAAHELAMQVASMNPLAIDSDGVSQDIINKEQEIAVDLARQEGKPENMLEKIAMGRVNKFLKENTLLNQAYTKDNKKTIKEYLNSVDKEVSVTGFKRVGLGI